MSSQETKAPATTVESATTATAAAASSVIPKHERLLWTGDQPAPGSEIEEPEPEASDEARRGVDEGMDDPGYIIIIAH